jgi:nucleoid-associated protein YgaU
MSARLAVLALGFVLVGAPVVLAQSYDLEAGDYLTEEEYKKLSKDEALAYCQKLTQEIDIQNDNAVAANSQMGDIDAEIAALRSRLAEAKAANEPLAGRVAELEARLKELTDLPRSYTVVPGDWLIKISGKPRIYNDRTSWRRIYEANLDKIRDPNLIFPDQIFLIPR